MTKLFFFLLIFSSLGLAQYAPTPTQTGSGGGPTRSTVNPATLSCTVGVSPALIYNNAGVDTIYTAQGTSPCVYATAPTGAASSCSGGITAGCTGVTTQAAFTAITPNNSLYASLAAGSTDDARITNQESVVTAGGTIYTSTGAQSWAACPTFSAVSHALVFQGSTTINANCTIPSNVTLNSSAGAELNTASSIQVIIQGGINVNKRQQWINSVLTGGAGSILIQNQDVYMDWCGADPNGTSDGVVSSSAFATCASIHPGGRLLLNSNVGTNNLVYGYLVNTMLTLNNTQRLECEEPQSCIIDGYLMNSTAQPNHTAMIAFADSTVTTYPYTQITSSGGLSGVKLAGIHLGGTINPNLSCLYLGGDPLGVVNASNYGAADLVFYNTYFTGCNAGIEWGNNSFSHTFHGGASSGNNYGLLWPSTSPAIGNSGETSVFGGYGFNNNLIAGWYLNSATNSGEWECDGCHFDFNGYATTTIGGTANTTVQGLGPAIQGTASTFIRCSSCNLEQYKGHVFSASNGTNTGYPFVFDCPECTFSDDATAHAFTVTNVSSATPAVVTVGPSSTQYPIVTGMYVTMASVGGCTSVNGNQYQITLISSTNTATTFSLTGATCNSSYTSGGTATYSDPQLMDYGGTGNTATQFVTTLGNAKSGGESVNYFIAQTGSTKLKPHLDPPPLLVNLGASADTTYWFGGLGNPGCWTTGSAGSLTNSSCGTNGTISGFYLPTILTSGNCSSSASPASCSSYASGSVAVAAGSTTLVVDTSAVTASSQVQLTFDSSLGTKLGVTCNTTPVQGTVSARTAGTSFTITVPAAPTTNPACFSYSVIN